MSEKVFSDNFLIYNIHSEQDLIGSSVKISCQGLNGIIEHFWVEIIRKDNNKLIGKVNNILITKKDYKLGSLVCFDFGNIKEIKSKNQKELEKNMELNFYKYILGDKSIPYNPSFENFKKEFRKGN